MILVTVFDGLVSSIALAVGTPSPLAEESRTIEASYFEGRWAFAEETCDQSSNWTLLEGGNFVSEDLTGTWHWNDERLILNLIDFAIDEETGEQGGPFQMEGPVSMATSNQFTLVIEPDRYVMKRCR